MARVTIILEDTPDGGVFVHKPEYIGMYANAQGTSILANMLEHKYAINKPNEVGSIAMALAERFCMETNEQSANARKQKEQFMQTIKTMSATPAPQPLAPVHAENAE